MISFSYCLYIPGDTERDLRWNSRDWFSIARSEISTSYWIEMLTPSGVARFLEPGATTFPFAGLPDAPPYLKNNKTIYGRLNIIAESVF